MLFVKRNAKKTRIDLVFQLPAPLVQSCTQDRECPDHESRSGLSVQVAANECRSKHLRDHPPFKWHYRMTVDSKLQGQWFDRVGLQSRDVANQGVR